MDVIYNHKTDPETSLHSTALIEWNILLQIYVSVLGPQVTASLVWGVIGTHIHWDSNNPEGKKLCWPDELCSLHLTSMYGWAVVWGMSGFSLFFYTMCACLVLCFLMSHRVQLWVSTLPTLAPTFKFEQEICCLDFLKITFWPQIGNLKNVFFNL